MRSVLRQESKGQGAHSELPAHAGGGSMARLISQQLDGPIFRPSEVRAWRTRVTREVEVAVAEYALWRIKAYNASDFKNPTGHYRSQLRVVRRGAIQVNDSGTVYGPWLEGTGSRNAKSRFKGYWHWRRARADVERQAVRIANQTIARNIGRLS